MALSVLSIVSFRIRYVTMSGCLYCVEWDPSKMHAHLDSQNVTFLGNRVFAGVIS